MSDSLDYVPYEDNRLCFWAKTLLEYSVEHFQRWKVADPNDFIAEPLENFEAKLLRTKDPNCGRVDKAVKKEAKKILVKACRQYVQGFLARNPHVSIEDKTTMRLKVYDEIPTNIPPPSIPVTGRLTFPSVGLVEMCEIRPDGEKIDEKSKYGVRIYFGILNEATSTCKFRIAAPPKTGDDLPHSVFTRQKRYRFIFTDQRGKEAFFCMRFENSKGEAGPWGKIISAHVP